MENKNTEINELLVRLKQELLQDYKIVDFWEADTTAIGIQIGTALIYISTFNYDKTHKYNIIIEKYDTGEIIEKEKESTYNELVEIIQKIQE
ncbi:MULTISPECIES: hypothetical protein [Chryseobacterium]|uniref:Uncharacterized protein n=2 Tax=Chryseobacterium TaxID=59732 RepID=A0A511YNZ6_9FLAO|nr:MULTISPECIES: hypothetical protein [Chryseobacterium]MBL7880431.1 hypothetical protein [Chryseobacterium gambrini]GEN76923.1 hypothetical protein CHA01nite_26630 [Chryseobacterium hagamense]SIT28351.1 hypothetical protein SAMN05421785_1282 [Chryseobacterium gambrini]